MIEPQQPEMPIPKRPTKVCFCGSTRFKDAFVVANEQETLAGRIVLTVGCFKHLKSSPITVEQESQLNELHLRKIDMADEILIIDVDGYIGQGTKRERDYATTQGKRIRYLSQEYPELTHSEPQQPDKRLEQKVRGLLDRLGEGVFQGKIYLNLREDVVQAILTAMCQYQQPAIDLSMKLAAQQPAEGELAPCPEGCTKVIDCSDCERMSGMIFQRAFDLATMVKLPSEDELAIWLCDHPLLSYRGLAQVLREWLEVQP